MDKRSNKRKQLNRGSSWKQYHFLARNAIFKCLQKQFIAVKWLAAQKIKVPDYLNVTGAQSKKTDPPQKTFSIPAALLWTFIGLQLISFILFICINLYSKSSLVSYEYKTLTFDRYEKQEFVNKMQELDKDGWEYIGTLNQNEALLRRVKTKDSPEKEKEEDKK